MREIWLILQKKFNIIQVVEIEIITYSVIKKSFKDYQSVNSYY